MVDTLFSAPSILETQHMFDIAQLCLKNSGLIIAPEKFKPLHLTITWGSLLTDNALLPN